MNEDKEQKQIQLRALLAFGLCAAILFGYQYFMEKFGPPKPAPKAAPAPAAASAPAAAPAAASAPPAAAPKAPAARGRAQTKPAAAQAGEKDQTFIVETDTFLVALSNRGGVATSWTLKRYKDDIGKPLELVNTTAAGETGYPFSLAFRDSPPPVDLNQALFQAETPSGRLTGPVAVTFYWSNGNLAARKTFRFSKDSYVVEVESEVRQGAQAVPHLLAWRGGFGDAAVSDQARSVKTFYYDSAQAKVVWVEAKEAEKGPVRHPGNYLYAGIQDLYFAAAFLPAGGVTALELETSAKEVATSRQAKKQWFAGAAVGAAENRFRAYVGPKDLQLLRSIRPELPQLVDFGFFSFIAYPLFLGLELTYQRLVPNFGWAIVLLTIVINFALFPLKLKSMKSMKKMQRLQPLIKHINDKYKSLPLRDSRRQDQNKEVMELYGKYGVNPLGGCLPMLLQMPFFFAFYTVLTISIEMRQARWLWVPDLSSPEPFVIKILPILMIATQFWYQKMTPATTADPAQQKMMQFMPLIMGFFFYSLSSGLVLYWLTGNLVGIAQQLFINRLPEPELDLEPAKRGRTKKQK